MSPTDLKTGRVMVKDEDVCLHCGLCAERCPTGAWDVILTVLRIVGPRSRHDRRVQTIGDHQDLEHPPDHFTPKRSGIVQSFVVTVMMATLCVSIRWRNACQPTACDSALVSTPCANHATSAACDAARHRSKR